MAAEVHCWLVGQMSRPQAPACMQSPEDNVHNGEISPEEFDRLSLLLRPPTDRRPEESSPMDTSPSPFIGTHLCLHDNICASCSAAL